jgi:hypothetical protein
MGPESRMRTTARGARGRTIGVAAAVATAQAKEGPGLTAAERPASPAPIGASLRHGAADGLGWDGHAPSRRLRRPLPGGPGAGR